MTIVFQIRQLEWNFLCILFWLPFEMDKYCQILFCILVYLLSFFLFVFHFENVWDSLVCWRAIQWHCLSPSFPTFRPSPHARSKTAVTWLADCHCFTADKKQTSQSATKDRTIAILQKLMMRQSNFSLSLVKGSPTPPGYNICYIIFGKGSGGKVTKQSYKMLQKVLAAYQVL